MQSANTIGGGGGSYPGGGGTGSRTRDLGLRAQKKLLGRIVATGAGRSLFIDDATASLLDNLYKLMENVAKSNPHLDKKEPEKVLKNIVKLSIKVCKERLINMNVFFSNNRFHKESENLEKIVMSIFESKSKKKNKISRRMKYLVDEKTFSNLSWNYFDQNWYFPEPR